MRSWSKPSAIVFTLAIVALTGCQPVWVKSGESGQEFAAASSECNADTRHGFFGNGLIAIANRQAYFDRCVAAHGYRQVDPHDVPSGEVAHASVSPTGLTGLPFARD
jgi:hypothetical protein